MEYLSYNKGEINPHINAKRLHSSASALLTVTMEEATVTARDIVSQYDSDSQVNSVLYCDICEHPIHDPLNKGALVWEILIQEYTVLNTAFRVTHKLPGCIQERVMGTRSLWRYISDFFIDGKVNFGPLLDPRYDEFGYRIDPDAEYDLDSLNQVLIKLSDVLESKQPIKPKREKLQAARDRAGYVYLIQSPTGKHKIGRTVNPADRMKTFTVKLPFEVAYVCVIATEDMYALERTLHRKFKNQRVNGEWFDLSADDIEYIKGLAK